jgi:AcrR family transcriptional regulator
MAAASLTTIPPESSPSAGQSSVSRRPRSSPGRRAPERTREQILQAAIREFADKGLGGARVDAIAARAGANKRMLYHYFGSKADLFLAVLERVYDDIRGAETDLHLEALDPVAAMRKLVEFSFGYFIANPHFIPLLNSENLHSARHLKRSKRIREMHSPLVAMISRMLERGRESGAFRRDVDPVQLYVSIAALGYFYFSNIHTLSTIFGRDLSAPRRIAERKRHAADMVLGYLRP